MSVAELILVPIFLVVFGGLSLFPLVTFLVLFTSFGDIIRRWMRRKSGQRSYRFDLRSLMIGMAWVGISIATVQALADTRYLGVTWLHWVILAPFLSFGIAMTRYALDSWDERQRDRKLKREEPERMINLPDEVCQTNERTVTQLPEILPSDGSSK